MLLDNGWIRPSTASHAASVVSARKVNGTWHCCQDYRALNAITQRSVEPLPHVDQLVDETRCARSPSWTWPALTTSFVSVRATSARRPFGYLAANLSFAWAPLASTACLRS